MAARFSPSEPQLASPLKADDLLLSNKAMSLANEVWKDMRNEKINHLPGKPIEGDADYTFPQLNTRALGLMAKTNEEMVLFTGTASCTLTIGDLAREALDGSRFARIADSKGQCAELHWGKILDQRYILYRRPDNVWFADYFASEANGKTFTDYHYRFANGDVQTSYHPAPGSSASRRLRIHQERDGSITRASLGERPSDNFAVVSRKQNGIDNEIAIMQTESGVQQVFKYSRQAEVTFARKKLLDILQQRHTDSWTWTKVQADMMKFESQRLPQIEEMYVRSGMDKSSAKIAATKEIAETYDQARRILQFGNMLADQVCAPYLPTGRLAVACAEQIIDHASNPTEITQGDHPTCTASTLESRIYTRHPAQAARLVADLAISGRYRSTKNKVDCKVDSESLKVHNDSQGYVPADGQRGIASQIFQIGTLNLMYACNGQNLTYVQRDSSKSNEDGDSLLDKSGREVAQHPLSNHAWLMNTAAEITEEKESCWIIRANDPLNLTAGSILVNSSDELRRTLEAAKARGNFPLAIRVFTDHDPLYSESGSNKTKKTGAHILCISDYDSKRGMVCVDNHWIASTDHIGTRALTLEQTMEIMKDPTLLRVIRAVTDQFSKSL